MRQMVQQIRRGTVCASIWRCVREDATAAYEVLLTRQAWVETGRQDTVFFDCEDLVFATVAAELARAWILQQTHTP